MIKYKTVTKTAEEIEDILCNQCGKSLYDQSGYHPHGVDRAWSSHGYGSKYDGCDWEFSLCEDCSFTLMKGFKIKPTLTSVWPEGADEVDKELFGHIEDKNWIDKSIDRLIALEEKLGPIIPGGAQGGVVAKNRKKNEG